MKIRASWIAVSAVMGLALLSTVGWTTLSSILARHIEDRLHRQTGQIWRIEGLALGSGPSIVLTGLATGMTGGSAPTASARAVNLSGPFTLLTGGSGPLRVLAEGVTLGLALDGPPGVSASTARAEGAAGIATIDGVVTVASWDVAQDGRSLAVSVPTAVFTLDLDSASTGTAHRLDIAVSGHRLRIALDRPGAAEDRSLTLSLDPTGAAGHRAGLKGRLRPDGDGIRLDRLTGTVDGGSLTGEAGFGLRATDPRTGSRKPRLTADLRLDALTLAVADVEPGSSPGLTVPLPSGIVPDPRWFAAFEAEGRLAIGRLALGPMRSEGVAVAATVRGGVLDATLAAAQAYDGTIKARYGLAPAGRSGRHRLALTLTHGQLRPLMVDLLGIAALDGRATASLDVEATGGRSEDLVRSAAGSADVSVIDGRIDGVGLAALVSGQDGAGSATRFGYLGGRLRIKDGQAPTDDFALRSPLIEATGRGSLDLVGQTLDLTFQPAVTPQRGRRAGPGRALSVPVRVSGPWNDPSVSADMSALLRDPGATIEALQDLGTGLFGGGGGELGGLLDAIAPKPRQAAPAPRRR